MSHIYKTLGHKLWFSKNPCSPLGFLGQQLYPFVSINNTDYLNSIKFFGYVYIIFILNKNDHGIWSKSFWPDSEAFTIFGSRQVFYSKVQFLTLKMKMILTTQFYCQDQAQYII